MSRFMEEIEERDCGGDVFLSNTGCFGICDKGPIVVIYPDNVWYGAVTPDDVTEIMDEHIEVGNRFPSVKLNTTYSFGLDDQEFTLAFETDEPGDFLDLVMALRETDGSRYTGDAITIEWQLISE